MGRKKLSGKQLNVRLTFDENDVIALYAKIEGRTKGGIVHDFITEKMGPMLLTVHKWDQEQTRKEIEEDAKDPTIADWTNTLPGMGK
jgi:hypothetical protein